jgi:hypothetical protein
MRVHSSTRYLALVALTGALACASNKARTDEGTPQPDQAAAARDTTTGRDTLNQENPPGYRGMERDTTVAPEHQQTPTDTFLQKQGQGAPQDTAGYSGMERVDTTGRTDTTGYNANPSQTDTSGYNANPSQTDTSGYNANPGAGQDTSGMSGMDSTNMHGDSTGASSGAAGLDSTGLSKTGDTTGYQQSQQQSDTTTSR